MYYFGRWVNVVLSTLNAWNGKRSTMNHSIWGSTFEKYMVFGG